MKAGGGLLLLLLIGMGIYLYLAATDAKVSHDTRKKIEPEVRQMAGRDSATGEDASNAIVFDTVSRNNQISGVVVKSIVPQSDVQKYYGLLGGDVITQLGALPVEGTVMSDTDAKAYFLQAYQQKGELAVTRNGQHITLPRDRNLALTPAGATGVKPAGPAAPVAIPPPSATPPAEQPKRTNARSQANDIVKQLEGKGRE